MLFIYRLIINIIFLISPFIVFFRILKKKEDPKRFIEKLGIFKNNKKNNNLIWFHGSSVGEILSIIPLIQKLEKKNKIKKILVTSNTLSSAKVLKRIRLKKTIHQYFPLDTNFLVKKFINHWKPKAVFFVESEIWPNMILKIKEKKIPLILLNSRITKKSFKKWKKISSFSQSIFNKFDLCLSQNSETSKYLRILGAKKIKKIGNLKYAQIKLNFKDIYKENPKKYFKNKKIIFTAVSTHEGEEKFCGKTHLRLKKKFKNIVTVIIPRHVHRSETIKNDLITMGLKVHLHTRMKMISHNTDVYIVNTFGDTNSFLKLSKIAFMGKSISANGGQNPLEAARLGIKIIHGPNIENFEEVYKMLKNLGISTQISSYRQLENQISSFSRKKSYSKKIIKKLAYKGEIILNNNEKEINKYL